jgi:hypothetical protein
MSETFNTKIKESSRDLTKREMVILKDISSANKLDEAVTDDGYLLIQPVAYAIVAVHNDKSDTKDYDNYVIICADGEKYATGSQPFWNSFKDIWDEMKDEPDWELKVYRRESRNYKGKYFITCALA